MNDALKEWLEQLRLFEFMSLKEHKYSAQSANASSVEVCRKSRLSSRERAGVRGKYNANS
jgi:hypothetical protein